MSKNSLQQFIEKHQLSRKSRIVALGVIVAYIAVVWLIGVPILGNFLEIENPQEPRTFVLPLHINLNGTRSYDIDVSFKLTFNLNMESLIVDEPVDLRGKAVVVSDKAENISRIDLGFQNCLAYNTTTDEVITDKLGIPYHAYLNFFRNDSGMQANEEGLIMVTMLANHTVTWSIDGNFKPLIGITYSNGTKSTMMVDDIAITVFPREQLTQTKINEVNTGLSVAVFIFSFFSVISVFLDLWQWGDKPVITFVTSVTGNSKPKIEKPSKSEVTEKKEL